MGNFFAELKRRHIYRVAAAYAVVAWLLLQIVNNVIPIMQAPAWVGQFCLLVLVLGFPMAVFAAWMRELPASLFETPQKATITDLALIGVLLVVISLVSYQQFAPPRMTAAAVPGVNAAGETAVKPEGISLAVLPFLNLSGDAAQEFFSDGITEEITSALAKVPDLRVVGRTSAFQFKGQNKNLKDIGQTLSATHLLEGSVRKAGTRLRITAQLIKADDDTHVWTESYDRDLPDIFAIQEDIAHAIADALRRPLNLPQGEQLVSSRTGDFDTYTQYLRAKAAIGARSSDGPKEMEALLARDPNFAPSWALNTELHDAWATSESRRDDAVENVRRSVLSHLETAEMAARKAIALDPRLPSGYGQLGANLLRRAKWADAEDMLQRAFMLDPDNPDALENYMELLTSTGRLKEALETAARLRGVEPFIANYNVNIAENMITAGQYDAAIAILKAVKLSPGSFLGFPRNVALASAHAAQGQYSDAADTLLLIQVQVSRQAVESAARLMRTAPAKTKSQTALPSLPADLNFVYLHVGASNRVLEYPERLAKIEFVQNGMRGLWGPLYAPIRKTERFKRLVRSAGLVDYWRAKGWPDLCHPHLSGDDFECE